MKIIKQSKQAQILAIEIINKGGIIVCPTDTVYGFLADAGNKRAVERIYKIKKRPRSKPLPVFVKDIKMARQLAGINEEQIKILKQKWPGKFTFVLNKKNEKGTIALRMPKYKFLNNLLKKINKPLVQTSVNISNNQPLVKISDIINQFKRFDILLVNGGNLKKQKPSKVLDLTKNKIRVLRK